MVSGELPPGPDPAGSAATVQDDPRTHVSRVVTAGHSIIRKVPRGPDADRRLRHELAMLQRLRGVPGVVQLAAGAADDPGALLLADAGGLCLARVATPLPITRLMKLAVALARAVAGMHARGVMHGNICPANIVLDRDDSPCLVDFGLATVMTETHPAFGPAGEIAGDLAYLAPEQTGRTGRSADERADLYALGATLYELATGAAPFERGDPLRLVHDHLARVPVPPAVAHPAVPEPLSDIILHLLEKEPDHRYQTADGLAYDLQRLHDVLPTAASPALPVGTRDTPLRLAPPSRLVGRDAQTAAMAAAFADALVGDCRAVLLTGAAGVGKTALVDQLRPVVTGHDGWFVAGRFDMYRRDLRSDAVHQALRALARLLLAEPDAELTEIRERIVRALGPNAALIAAVVPEFAAVLSVPPDPGDPLTAQARAQWATVQVLRAVASPKRPIVMFVDDLQWAGRPSLGLFDMLLSAAPVDGLLLVGAHRTVESPHPLAAMLARWPGQDDVRRLRLADLAPRDVETMLAEMLHLDANRAAALARLITPLAGGNPVETVELLNALRQNALLTATADGWRWDEEAVRTHLAVADPDRLLTARFEALPGPTRQLMRAMACLGGRAEPGLLATATATPPELVEQLLAPAQDEGLLVATPGPDAVVQFRHDRAREAALTGVDVSQQRALHLAMARRLAGVAKLFAVAAQQYLPVIDAVQSVPEQRQVV
ncbi:MAG TPA: AAA family ATPase, partial [Actinoplanes sp.]|nr:AAA family ATPase [Actinoplanes sp.]